MKPSIPFLVVGLLMLAGTASAVTWTADGDRWTSTNGSYTVVMWNATGTHYWNVPVLATSADILVVAGGGGGGNGNGGGGGGGAGGLVYQAGRSISGNVTILVGAGGAGGSGGTATNGTRGTNSSFDLLYAIGGGYGAATTNGQGGYGGSGGGGHYTNGAGGISNQTSPDGGTGYGHNGGYNTAGSLAYGGGGGGGAGAIGANGTSSVGGNGGAGMLFNISGGSQYYAGGGGGGVNSGAYTAGTGGSGVGGAGGAGDVGSSAVDGTGSGGGGGGSGMKTGGDGGDGVVIVAYIPAAIHPVPSFTSNVTSGVPSTAVQFNDTSVTDIWTWNWSYTNITPGNNTETIFATDQNPVYTFGAGYWNIHLNVSNASGYQATTGDYFINVTASGGLSGFNRQDILLDQAFLITLQAKTSGGSLITSTDTTFTVTNLSGVSNDYVSSSGVYNLTSDYDAYEVIASAEGYNSDSTTFVADENKTVTLTLATSPSDDTTKQTTYAQQLVRFKIVDKWGTPLPGSQIEATYIASTLPSTDISWLVSAFGIDEDVAEEMVNSELAMSGNTTDDGSLTFMMFPAITYGLTITNSSIGLNNYKEIAPKDTYYTIYCPISGQVAINNTLTAVADSSLPFYKLNNSGYYNLSMIYQDESGYTTNLVFEVIDYTGGGTVVYSTDWGNPGTSVITDNYTAHIPLGQEYIWRYNATKV